MFKEFAENKNAKLPSSQYRGWAIWRTGTMLWGAYKNLPKIADKLFISDYPQIIAGIGCFVEKQMEQ